MEYEIQSKLLKHLNKVLGFVEEDDASPYEGDEEPGFVFDLIYGTKDNIVLIARDQDGKKVKVGGNILSLTRDGKLKRYKSVSSKLGFSLNSAGQVVLEK